MVDCSVSGLSVINSTVFRMCKPAVSHGRGHGTAKAGRLCLTQARLSGRQEQAARNVCTPPEPAGGAVTAGQSRHAASGRWSNTAIGSG